MTVSSDAKRQSLVGPAPDAAALLDVLTRLYVAADDVLLGISKHNSLDALAPGRRNDIKGPVVQALSRASYEARDAIAAWDARPRSDEDDPEALARRLHETYERLAPSFGYETRPDTKAFDPASPNGKLMIAVCEELRRAGTFSPKGGIELVDEELRPLVQALWSAGIATKASCSGHGHRPGNIILADGRELIIAADYETGRRIDDLFPLDIHGELRG